MYNYPSGIYHIYNTVTGKSYVGSAASLKRRWIDHRNLLLKDQHHSIKLQRSWNKHGKKAFKYLVLEYVEQSENLIEREQFWIEKLNAFGEGYNMTPTAGNMLGFTHSEKTRQKMSKDRKGTNTGPKSEKHKASLSAAISTANAKLREQGLPHPNAGKPKSEETKAKFRKPKREGTSEVFKQVQRKIQEERKAAGLEHPLKGRKRTPEQIAKAVEAKRRNKEAKIAAGTFIEPNKGKKRTEEQRQRIAEAQLRLAAERAAAGLSSPLAGKVKSEEHRRKISESKMGKKPTPEHVETMRQALIKLYADRKAQGIPHHRAGQKPHNAKTSLTTSPQPAI